VCGTTRETSGRGVLRSLSKIFFCSSYGCMRYHARASATVNTTLALPFETRQQASRAATIEGPSPRGRSFPGFEPGSRRY
jgi:hypothetical protein